MMQHLAKHSKAWLFNDPVDPVKLGILDYNEIIRNPMDFGTIKKKLKDNQYDNMKKFLEDVELVFNNCILYNGEAS